MLEQWYYWHFDGLNGTKGEANKTISGQEKSPFWCERALKIYKYLEKGKAL